MRVALLFCLLAFSSLFAFSNAGCSTKGDALKVCEMLVGRQNKNPDDDVNTYCGDYEKDLERELCLAVIASGLFEEGFNAELCKAEANKKYLSDFVVCEEEDEEGNGKGFLELQTALMKRGGSRNKASTTVAACAADPKSAALNAMGKPVNVIIDPPWTNAKLNKERPYSEPPNRLTVGAANTGCELHPEGAYAFCPNGGINPNNAGATNCVDANGALHTAACGNNAIGAHVGNFFGAGGYLDTYFGGAPVTMTHPGSVKNPSSFLWAVDMCGNIKMGDENQDRQAPAAIANRANAKNRAIKHGDLIPTPNGDRRGKGRVGGEIRRITKNGTTAWVVNGCSSYSTLRERANIPFATSSLKSKHLCHAMAHLNAFGFDTANAKLIKCNKWYHATWNANCLDCTNPNAPTHVNCF